MAPLEVESVLQVLPNGPLRLLCSLVMLPHFLIAFIIFANPLNQQIEEMLDVPFGMLKFILHNNISLKYSKLNEQSK